MVHFRAWPFRQQIQHWASRFSKPINFGSRAVLVSSLLALTLVSGGKRLQLFETLETASFDLLTRLQAQADPDPRLLLVEVTEADLEVYGWPLSDQVVADIEFVKVRHGEEQFLAALDRFPPKNRKRD